MSWIALFIDDTIDSGRMLQRTREVAQAAATPLKVFHADKAMDGWAFKFFNVGRVPVQFVVPTLPSRTTDQVVAEVGLLSLPLGTAAVEG